MKRKYYDNRVTEEELDLLAMHGKPTLLITTEDLDFVRSLDLLLSEINELKISHPSFFNNLNNVITPLIACESHKADKEIAEQALKKVEIFLRNS